MRNPDDGKDKDGMKDHSDKEAYKMGKDRTTEDMIRILQEEVEIPQMSFISAVENSDRSSPQ